MQGKDITKEMLEKANVVRLVKFKKSFYKKMIGETGNTFWALVDSVSGEGLNALGPDELLERLHTVGIGHNDRDIIIE